MHIDLREFNTIDSTNDYLIRELKANSYDCQALTICVAKEQTKARGQFSRVWYSPRGENLYLSVLYTLPRQHAEPPPHIEDVGLKFASTIIKTLNDFEIQDNLVIKHPNDILYNNKKISGILAETFDHKNSNTCSIIIGIGLNVNMTHVPNNSIDQPWTSMQLILNQAQDIEQVKISLIDNLQYNIVK